jgi:filamentous hemagglutinin family protein
MFTTTLSERTLLQRLIAGWLVILQVLAPMLYAGHASAQTPPAVVNPDRSVQGQRPVVNVSANGVPVVQVAPPSAAGVSNNRFTEYNVGEKGLILNNTGANNQTQLAGWIAGNPMLGNSSAKTILNQVTGSAPTSLAGFTEVAGNRANVIVANPNGITCAGCGFINAPRITLTTGTPELGADGAVLGLRVQQGEIAMEGAGLSARNADQVDLVARSLRVNAEVWANKLDIVSGTGKVDYETGTVTAQGEGSNAPAVSLDVSQLGGMYANSIRMIGTESGVGVNIAGDVAALTGALEVSQAGDVRIVAGGMQAKGDLAVSSKAGIANAGAIHAEGKATLRAGGSLRNTGVLMAGQELHVSAGGVDNAGSIAAGAASDGKIKAAEDLVLVAGGDLKNSGQLLAGRDLTVAGRNAVLAGGNLTAANKAVLTATADLDNRNSRIQAGDITIGAAGKFVNANGTIESQERLSISALQIDNTNGTLKQTAGPIAGSASQGIVISNPSGGADGTAILVNDSGLIAGNAATEIKVRAATNAGGIIQSADTLVISGDRGVDNTGGKLLAGNGLQVNTDGNFTNRSGQVSVDRAVSISAKGALINNEGGNIQGSAVRLGAAEIDNSGGHIIQTGSESQSIVLSGSFNNTGGVFQSNAQNVILNAASIDNTRGQILHGGSGAMNLGATSGVNNAQGSIQGNGDVILSAGTAFTNAKGTIASKGNANLSANTIDNNAGVIAAEGDASLQASGALQNSGGVVQANGDIGLNAGSVDNTRGAISAKGGMDAKIGGSLDNKGGIIGTTDGALDIVSAGAVDNAGGKLVSGGSLGIKAASVDNTQDGRIQSASSASMEIGGALANTQGVILSGDKLVILAGGNIGNSSGAIEAAGDMTLSATNLDNKAGSIISRGDGKVSISVVKTLDNTDGAIGSNGSVAILAKDSFNNTRGTVTTGKDLEVDTARFINQDGKLDVSGAITLKMKDVFNNRGNKLEVQGGLIIHAAGIENGVDSYGVKGELIVRGQGLLKLQTEGAIDNAGGLIGSRGDVALAGGTIDNSGGIVFADKALSLSADGDVSNSAGTVQAGGTLTSAIKGGLDNREGIVQADTMHLQAGSLDNRDGQVLQLGTGGNVIDITGTLDNANGQLSSNGADLRIAAGDIINGGGLVSHNGDGKLEIVGTGTVDNSDGRILGAGELRIDTVHLANTGLNGLAGRIQGGRQVEISASGNLDNAFGSIVSAGGMQVMAAGNADNRSGTIQAAGSLVLGGGAIDNAKGTVVSLDNSGVRVSAVSALGNEEGFIGGNGDLAISVQGGGIANAKGTLYAAGAMAVTAQQDLDNQQGRVQAGTALAVDIDGLLDNRGGSVQADSIGLHAGSMDNRRGTLLHLGAADTAVNVDGALANSGGTIYSAGSALRIVTGSLDNKEGSLAHDGAGTFALTTDVLENDGGRLLAAGALSIDAQNVSNETRNGNSGLIQAAQDTTILARDKVGNAQGRIISGAALTIHAQGDLDNAAGTLEAARALGLRGDRIDNTRGQAVSLDNSGVTLHAIKGLTNEEGFIGGNGGVTAIVLDGGIDNVKGEIRAGSILAISTTEQVDNRDGTLHAATVFSTVVGGEIDNRGGLAQAASMQLQAGGIDNRAGRILQLDSAASASSSLHVAGAFNNANGELGSNNGTLTIAAGSIDNTEGEIVHGGTNRLGIASRNALDNSGGRIVTAGAISIQAGSIANTQTNGKTGRIQSANDAAISAGAGIANAGGIIASEAGLSVQAGGDIDNRGGVVEAAHALTLQASGIDSTGGRATSLGGNGMTVSTSGVLTNDRGVLAGNGAITLTAGSLSNISGGITAGTDLTVTAGTVSNTGGDLVAGDAMHVNVTGNLGNTGGKIQADKLTIQAGAIDNNAGRLLAIGTDAFSIRAVTDIANTAGFIGGNGNVAMNAQNIDNTGGTVYAKDELRIATGTLANAGGTLQAENTLAVLAQGTIDNRTGLLQADAFELQAPELDNREGTIVQFGTSDTRLVFAGAVNNAKGVIATNGGTLTLAASSIDNSEGDIGHAGDGRFDIVTGNLDNKGGKLRTAGDAVIAAHQVDNTTAGGTSGAIQADKGVSIAVSGSVDNRAGSIHSGAALQVQAQAGIVNAEGTMQAANALALQAADIDNTRGRLVSLDGSGTSVAATAALNNREGFIGGNGNVALAADRVDNTGGTAFANDNLTVNAGTLDNTGGTFESGATLTINAAQAIVNKQGTLQAEQLAVRAPGLDNSDGKILQLGGGDLELAFTGALDNTRGSIAVNSRNFTLQAARIDNNAGELTHAGNGALEIGSSGAFVNTGGNVRSAGAVDIHAQAIGGANGLIRSSRSAAITTAGDVANAGGSIFSGGALTVNAGGMLDNTGGAMEAANALTIQAAHIGNTRGRVVSLDTAGMTVNTAGTLNNDEGTIGGNGSTALSAGIFSNRLGTLSAMSDLGIAVNAIDNIGGSMKAGGALSAQVSGALNNAGGTVEGVRAIVNAGSIDNSAGKLLATGSGRFAISVGRDVVNAGGFIGGNGDVTLAAKTVDNSGGTAYAANDLGIDTDSLDNTSGTIQADGKLTVAVADELVNRRGLLQAQQFALQAPSLDNSSGKLLQTGNGDTSLVFTGDIRNAQGTIATNGVNLVLNAAAIDNTGGEVTHAGSGRLAAGTTALANDGGTLRSGGDIDIDAQRITSVSGLIDGRRDVVIASAAGIDNTGGSVFSGGALAVRAQGRLTNSAGTLEAADTLTLQASDIDNARGRAVSLGNDGVTIQAGNALSNQDGTIGGNGAVTLAAANLDNTRGRITGIGDVNVTAPVVTNTGGVIKSQQQLMLDVGSAGFLSNTGQGVLQGDRLNLNAPNLRNAGGSIIQTGSSDTHLQVNGTLDNTGGTIASNGNRMSISAQAIANDGGTIKHGGSHSLTLALPGAIANRGGVISSNGNAAVTGTTIVNTAGGTIDALGTLDVGATIALDNSGGVLQSDGALTVSTPSMSNNGGAVLTDGRLTLGVSGFDNTGGTLSAGQIAFQPMSSVRNAGGRIIQTGSHDLTLVVGQDIENTGGTIAANGNVTLGGTAIRNQGGTVRAAGSGSLTVNTGGAIDNAGGTLVAGAGLSVSASGVNNQGGQITAGGQLALSTQGSVNNNAGTIAANGNTRVSASSLSNRGGAVASTGGTLTLNTPSHIDNTGGRLESAYDLSLTVPGLTNTGGQITAGNLQINTQGQALDNAGGKIAARGTLNISSGQLNNRAGLLQANSAMTINTNGQALINTQSGGSNGIAGLGSVTLHTGSLDNQGGYIGAKGALSVNASGVNNSGGAIVSESTVNITAGSLANAGGQVSGTGDVDIHLGGGTLDNSNGLVVATGTLAVQAGSINNSNTGADKGLQGYNVSLNASAINNAGGTIRADDQLTLTGSTLDNSNGTISSAGTVVNNVTSTTNTQGTLIAARRLAMNSNTINGVGQYLSHGDLEFNYSGSYTNTSRMVASGSLTINSAGTVTNYGQIGANNVLNLTATDIHNMESGEIKAGTANILARNSLTNRGTIDGVVVNIHAGQTFVNYHKTYGDTLGITAGGHLANAAGAVIGARQTLSLSGENITNYANGYLISDRDMALAARHKVYNREGRIEARGNLTINAAGLENLNSPNFTMTRQVVSSDRIQLHMLPGSATPLTPGTYAFNGHDHGRLVLDSATYPLHRYGAWPYASALVQQGNADNGYTTAFNYPANHAVWSLFGVAPPGPPPAHPYANQWWNDPCSSDRPPPACYAYWEALDAWNAAAMVNYGQLDQKITAFNNDLYGRMVEDWYVIDAVRTTTESRVAGQSNPGQIRVGGNLILNGPGGSVLNDKSQIVVGGSVTGSASNVVQVQDQSVRETSDAGTIQLTELVSSGWFGGHRRISHAPAAYSRTYTPQNLGGASVWRFEPGIRPTYERNIEGRQSINVGQSATGAADANGNVHNLQGAHGTAGVNNGGSAGGASANPNGTGVSGGAVAQFNGQAGTQPQGVSAIAAETVNGNGAGAVHASGQTGTIQGAIGAAANTVTGTGANAVSATTAATTNTISGTSAGAVAGTVQSVSAGGASGAAAGNVTGNGPAATIDSVTGNAGSTVTAGAQTSAIDAANSSAANSITGGPGAQYSVSGTVQQTALAGPRAYNELAEVKAAGNGNLTVRSIVPTLALPGNVLFSTRPEPGVRWLVETDPRFADYRTWLSSDFMLAQLGRDPGATLKRLGDGYYEQRLIADQIIYATGYRFVGDYRDDEAQYQALMQAGVEFGNKFQLTVGVALSQEQMKQLTSDLVWLVEQDVTLADGSVQRVLVPQVYVVVKEGDLRGDGTLISARSIDLNLTGDLDNNALIATRDLMQITAQNIHNVSGGRLQGGTVELTARNDLNNLSGIIAGNAVTLEAGRDVNIRTRTIDTKGLGTKVTGTDVIAGVSADNLTITAGRDLNVQGARIEASKDLLLTADRNLAIGTVRTSNTLDIAVSGHIKATEVKHVGSVVSAGNNLTMAAGMQQDGDLKVTGSALNAGNDLFASGTNVTIGSAIDTRDTDILVKRKNATDTVVAHEESAVISRLTSGKAMTVSATGSLGAGNKAIAGTGDLIVQGAALQSTAGKIVLTANNDVQLVEQQLTSSRQETHQYRGGTLISKKAVNADSDVKATQSVGSTISGDSITIGAGRDLLARAATVAGTQDVTLIAKNNITLGIAQDTTEETRHRDEKTSGLFSSGGASITLGKQQTEHDRTGSSVTHTGSQIASLQGNVVIDAGKTYTQTASQVLALQGNIGIAAQQVDINAAYDSNASTQKDKSKSSGLTLAVSSPLINAVQTVDRMADAARDADDPRMKALAAATAALSVKNAVDELGKASDGNPAGVNLSISIGSSKSESTQTQSSITAVGSTVAAGNNVSITATGAGAESSINAVGSDIQAGNDATLKADNQVNLIAAQSTAEQHSTNKSSGGSIGLSIGTQGFGVTVSANSARGNADGEDVIHTNTHVEAGNSVTLVSGGDTKLQGGVVSGRQVTAEVGGDLAIESLQDTATYTSKQKSAGGSVTIGAGAGGSISAGKSNIDGTYASVVEQSGIKTGDGGFQVVVKGNTDLKGGVIASSDTAITEGRNSFDGKGEVTQSDIVNTASYTAKSAGVSLGVGGSAGASAGLGSDSDNATTVTKAGIGMSTEVDTTAAIQPIFDAAKVQAEVNAQVQITQAFSKEAPKAVASYAGSKAEELRKQAAAETDPEKKKALEAEQKKWDEGGIYRVALHTAAGALSGGASGAAGAAVSAGTADLMNDLQTAAQQVLEGAGLNATSAKAVAQGVAGLTAAGLGGMVGGVQGAGTALTVDANNRQLHPDETKWIKDNAKRFAAQNGLTVEEAEQRLAQQAFRQVQFGTEGTEDAQARAFLSQAHGMLPADPACPPCGPGYMFYGTPEQKGNAGMYAGTLTQTSGFYQANGLTQPTLQQIVNAVASDSAQRNAVAQRTVLAAMAAGTLALAPALSGVAAEAAAFAKNPVGYCLGNPAACTVAAETVAYTAAGVPQPGAGVPVKAGGSNPAGRLTYDAVSDSWTSPGGLVYGQGSAHGNRVLHVLDHTIPNPSKPVHSVFNVDRTQVIGLVDEAWAAKVGPGTLQANGNRVWVVDMGRQVGTGGQTSIQIVVRDGTTQVITAFPK